MGVFQHVQDFLRPKTGMTGSSESFKSPHDIWMPSHDIWDMAYMATATHENPQSYEPSFTFSGFSLTFAQMIHNSHGHWLPDTSHGPSLLFSLVCPFTAKSRSYFWTWRQVLLGVPHTWPGKKVTQIKQAQWSWYSWDMNVTVGHLFHCNSDKC